MKKIAIKIFLSYLKNIAKIQIVKINPLIIGVGGASGKSSLSEIISIILEDKYKLKKSGGKNSETGIPLNILDINLSNYSLVSWIRAGILAPVKLITNWRKYDIYVVEMGIDGPKPPKNMSYLLEIVKPRIGILTNIQIEHSVYFEELAKRENDFEKKEEILEMISREELLLLKSIDEFGRSVINLDDPHIKDSLPFKSKVITVSRKDETADFFISKVYIEENSFRLDFVFLKEHYKLKLPSPLPPYFAYTFLLAIATAFSFEINIKTAIELIETKFSLPPGRFSVFKGIKDLTIFDSSYNSSLEAATGALEAVREAGGTRRKVGILGDMRELGSLSRVQHEILAKAILRNLDFAILVGPMIQEYVSPILEKEKFDYVIFDSYKSAKDEIFDLIKSGDLVLVKGSQNTLFLERFVELLLADKRDREKLCRRGKYWDKIRRVGL